MGRDLDHQTVLCSCDSLGFSANGMRVKRKTLIPLLLEVLLVTAMLPAPGAEEQGLVKKTECPMVTS